MTWTSSIISRISIMVYVFVPYETRRLDNAHEAGVKPHSTRTVHFVYVCGFAILL